MTSIRPQTFGKPTLLPVGRPPVLIVVLSTGLLAGTAPDPAIAVPDLYSLYLTLLNSPVAYWLWGIANTPLDHRLYKRQGLESATGSRVPIMCLALVEAHQTFWARLRTANRQPRSEPPPLHPQIWVQQTHLLCRVMSPEAYCPPSTLLLAVTYHRTMQLSRYDDTMLPGEWEYLQPASLSNRGTEPDLLSEWLRISVSPGNLVSFDPPSL